MTSWSCGIRFFIRDYYAATVRWTHDGRSTLKGGGYGALVRSAHCQVCVEATRDLPLATSNVVHERPSKRAKPACEGPSRWAGWASRVHVYAANPRACRSVNNRSPTWAHASGVKRACSKLDENTRE